MVQQDKDVLDETLQSNQETFTSISDGGRLMKGGLRGESMAVVREAEGLVGAALESERQDRCGAAG